MLLITSCKTLPWNIFVLKKLQTNQKSSIKNHQFHGPSLINFPGPSITSMRFSGWSM